MRCVAVVIATVIESYLHFRNTKKVRYTAFFSDPIAYLKKYTSFGELFAMCPNGVSCDSLEAFMK